MGRAQRALVAEREAISEEKLVKIAANGLDPLLVTRLHRDPAFEKVLTAAAGSGAVFVRSQKLWFPGADWS